MSMTRAKDNFYVQEQDHKVRNNSFLKEFTAQQKSPSHLYSFNRIENAIRMIKYYSTNEANKRTIFIFQAERASQKEKEI